MVLGKRYYQREPKLSCLVQQFLFGKNFKLRFKATMKQLEEFQAQFQKEWLQFASKYQYDPDFGYLIPDDHEIKCFSIQPLRKILDILPELNKTGKIIQAVQSLEAIEMKEPYSFKDMVILHDTTAMIVQSYFLEKCKTTNQEKIRIPASLAEPLYISSEFLKCSPGNITVFEYNWKINHQRYKTDPFDLTYQDIELKWYFTGEKEEEANFFKLNFIGSFYLWKIVKQISFANYLVRHGPWLENEIIKKLNKAEKYWQKITEENTKLFSMNDIYFSKRLRPFISGFKNLYFQKVDKRLSAEKGNAGFDPSYQLFEGLFGISYKVHNPQFQVIRKQMRNVMAEIHKKSIEYGEENCDIRKYCMLSQPLIEAYNNLSDNQVQTKPSQTKIQQSTQRQKKLTIPEAYFTGIKDPYNAKSNPKGYIIYGVSINRRVMPKALEYLPKYLTANDLHYGNFGGNSQFNQLVAKLTGVYSKNQTMSVHNLSCTIDLFAKKHKKVSSQGRNPTINLDPIFEYAGAELVSEKDSVCHIIFSSRTTIQQDLKKVENTQKTTLLVLQDIKLNSRVDNENVFVCYQCSIHQSIQFASVHSSNPKKLQELIYYFNLHSISTLTQAAALSQIQPTEASNLQQGQQKMKTEIKAMIKDLNKTDVQNHNLHFFIGATSILAFIAKTFFQPGDTISVDTPLYAEIQGDFESRVSLKYVHENLFKGTLLKRVIRAKEDGSKGYVIVNANNPTGYVYPQNEIREVGEWAAKNTDFTIVFDEMYINLVHGKAKTCSSVEYAVKSPNVQTIRGFAKQFGLCGFKVAYLITSNQKAISSYERWKSLLVPHRYSLWIIGNMLQSSNHGKQILLTGCEMARQAIETTCLELDRWNLKYMKPEAGVFVFVDLRDYLRENIQLNEYLIFKKMFYEYKVNASCGLDYKASEPGFFRICTVIDQENIKEGIRRLGLMIKGEPFI